MRPVLWPLRTLQDSTNSTTYTIYNSTAPLPRSGVVCGRPPRPPPGSEAAPGLGPKGYAGALLRYVSFVLPGSGTAP